MFAEEAWTEAVVVCEQTPAACHAKPNRKSRVISKHCLKQTLQTLGSVPVWNNVKPFEDSDDASEGAPVHVNKTKKRCKKRKKDFDAESEGQKNGVVGVAGPPVKRRTPREQGENGAVGVAGPPVKRRKPKQREQGLHMSLESAKDKDPKEPMLKDSSCPEDDPGSKLSRRQWKNKMKNKKRCKNKFRETEEATINTKGGQVQRQALSKAPKTQSPDLSSGRVRSGEESGTRKPPSTQTSKKAITVKESSRTKYLKPIVGTSFSKGPKPGSTATATCPSPCEPCEKLKPDKGKKTQLRAKKLRHILNSHIADSNKKVAEEEGEKRTLDNEEGESPLDRSSALRSRMEKRLESARFRYINEQLYTSTSGEAKRMFKQDPDAIRIYHKGYMEQVKHWPANPVDLIISYIRQKPQSLVVADFGCGDCKIARSVKNKVHSFDLAPVCDLVTACDMAKVPLNDDTVDIAVFCLSLMGTNLSDFLTEANRVLQMGGILKIAEVASRFDNIRQFIGVLSRLGFKLVSKDTENSHFYSFEFVKVQNAPGQVKKAGLQLKPCVYKKR